MSNTREQALAPMCEWGGDVVDVDQQLLERDVDNDFADCHNAPDVHVSGRGDLCEPHARRAGVTFID